MGKKAQERSSIPVKENSNCMRSFINIFEFSQGHRSRKLLADIKCGSARYPGSNFLENNDLDNTCEGKHEHVANDVDVCGGITTDSNLPSVKALIDEEMSKERISKAFGFNFKPNQKMAKNDKNDPDPLINNLLDSAQVVLEQFKCREPVESSNFIFDLAALMIEFYSVSRHCPDLQAEKKVGLCTPSITSHHKKNAGLDESVSQISKHSMLQEALVVEAEVFLSQKIDDAKRLVGNGVIHSQEFMDALEILNSNKELFLKLIQDPNSLVFNRIHELLKQRIVDFSKLESFHCLDESGHFEDKLGNLSQNGKSSSNQMFQKPKLQIFSKKNDNCKKKTLSKDQKTLEEMSRIVVLKPHLSRNHGNSAIGNPSLSSQSKYTNKQEKYSDKAVSHFSFREIKRKLRHIIGENRKEHHLVSKDDILNSVPCGYKALAETYRMTSAENNCKKNPNKTDCGSENTCQSSPAVRETYNKSKEKEWQQKFEAEIAQGKKHGISPGSLFHIESSSKVIDKHFLEKLCTDNRTVNLTNNKIFKSLEELLSSSDNMYSPKFCPPAVEELTLSPEATNSEPKLQLLCDTTTLIGTTVNSCDLDVEMLAINSEAENDKVELQDETSNGEHYTEGRREIVEIENITAYPSESSNTLNIAAEPVGSEHSFSCERCGEEGCSMLSEPSTPNEKPRILIPSASISPSSLIINDFMSSELIIEKPERPSPVSVLEPFFLEDDASPDHPSITCDSSTIAEILMPLQPIHLNYNEDSAVISTSDCSTPHQRYCSYDMEAMKNYVRTMLETYNFDSEMTPERLPSSELLLQSSALDEIKELSSYREDPKLMLDCVSEVLIETTDRRFQTCPCTSFLKSTARPMLEDIIIQEVCTIIESYFSSQFQSTLNEIMKKDMDSTMWMDLRFQMECITAEISCGIFEELMEESMFELFRELVIVQH